MRIKVTVPTGKRDWLIWKVNSATETKMDFNKKDDDNLPRSVCLQLHSQFITDFSMDWNNDFASEKLFFKH